MKSRLYRHNPLYTQLQVGDLVRRRETFGLPAHLARRLGQVVAPPRAQRPGIWYVSILWDGSQRPDDVYIGRITPVVPPADAVP